MAKKKRVEKSPREMTRRQLSHHKRQQRRQRFIFIGGISVIAAVVLIILAGLFFGEYYPLKKTIVKVYDTNIKTSMFIETLEIAGRSQPGIDLQSQADNVLNGIIRNEVNRRGAEKLGVTVSDGEVKNALAGSDFPSNEGGMAIVRASLLVDKVKNEYFAGQVPESEEQVYLRAIMVESEEVVPDLRQRVINGDNFTMLAEEYAVNTASLQSKGDFGMHPASILISHLGTSVPVDYAFKPEAKAGDISYAVSDNMSYKKLGYWIIRILDRSEEGEVLTQALLLADKYEAERIKAMLESGEELAGLADQYSQYSPSKDQHGEMGLLAPTDNVSDAFNGYVFSPETELDKWSDPIQDDAFWTKGGAWLIQVVEKEQNRALSADDRAELIDSALNQWGSDIWLEASVNIITSLTSDLKQWAIDKAIKELAKG